MIRKAVQSDVPDLLKLIHELALFEKAPQEVINTEEQIILDGFGMNPLFNAFVAEYDHRVIGFAIVYYRYSTWKGKCLYLEDLIVTREYRNKGIGQQLFDACIDFGKVNLCHKMVWQVLDWNKSAIRFYTRNNASMDGEWINGSIDL
jgi:GNAT superfamily N-acetyltransferase